jgi:IclR family transcriptional regulator, KDG regulon repressor
VLSRPRVEQTEEAMTPGSRYSAPAVDAALAILETLGGVHETSLTELAHRVGLGKSSVFRLLMTLARRGYVEKNPQSERYRLTCRLFAVGSSAADRLGLREAANPVMQRLAEETGETVNLGVLDGTRVVNLHKVEGRHLLRMHLELGGGLPAQATALGKVLLAALKPAEVRRRFRSHRLERLTARTIGNRRSLGTALARIRKQGVALDDEECSLGLRCVAAPILNHLGLVVAALSVSGPCQRLPDPTLPRLAESVRAAAQAVSQRLGFTSGSPQRRTHRKSG